MAGMFPTMVADPNDPNRRFNTAASSTWPRSLKIGYWMILASAVVMLVSALLMLRAGVPEKLDADVATTFRQNLRIAAYGNIVLALCLTAAAAFFERGSKVARRWASAFIMLAIFLNFAGFFVGVSGWSSFVIVVLLGLAVFFIFRPQANAFVDHRSGDLWQGVE